MKKTLLAAALAVGFAGVAQAETSVTLYGVVGTGIGYEQNKGVEYNDNGTVKAQSKSKRFGAFDGGNALGDLGNRWGLRGVEDLGNGLRVVFTLEAGFNNLTGDHAEGETGRLFNRRSTVGLHSDSWGSIDIGRQTNVASNYMIGIVDPFGGGFGAANGGQIFKSGNTVRWDNTIMYQTPNFNGFQAALGYSFNVNGDQQFKYSGKKDVNSRGITMGLKYENGPLAAALTYDQISNSAAKQTLNDDGVRSTKTVHEWALAGSYDFEVVKVHAGFGQARNGRIGAFKAVGDPKTGIVAKDDYAAYDLRRTRVNNYMLGLSAPIGGGTLMVSYGLSDPNRRVDPNPLNRKKTHLYGIGYDYPLSKRTNVYAAAGQVRNVGHVKSAKYTSIGAGLTHRF